MQMKNYKKLIKMILWLLIIGLLCYQCSQPNRKYLKFGSDKYGSYKVEIPYDIVKKQDCIAFKKWAESGGPQLLAKDACPWAKPIVTGSIGKFTVNGVKFNVPRKLLFFDNGKNQTSDGEQPILFLRFIYPGITPLTAEDWSKVNNYEISVHIEKAACAFETNPALCDEVLEKYRLRTQSKDDKISGAQPKFIKKDKDLNMDLYHWVTKKGELQGYYVRGDVWHPDYWMDCGKNACEVFLNYANKKVIIRYMFMTETLLHRHDELREKIISLLDEWNENK